MAKFEIQGGNMTEKQFRRELRKYGLQYRRWGTLKVLCAWPNYRDAKSKKQLTCRERFKKAQELMMEDFKNPENAKWWNDFKEVKGYKTAKGCARAYYYHLLCEEEKSRTIPGRHKPKIYKVPSTWVRTPLYRLDTVENSVMEVIYKFIDGKITADEKLKQLRTIQELRKNWPWVKEEHDYESGKPPCRWRFNIRE